MRGYVMLNEVKHLIVVHDDYSETLHFVQHEILGRLRTLLFFFVALRVSSWILSSVSPRQPAAIHH
jgi:hypothetical protein